MTRPAFDPDALRRAGINLDGAKVLGVNVPGFEAGAQVKPRSKYGNVRTEYRGIKYDSKAEAAYAESLDRQKVHGLIRWWMPQPRFRLGCPENLYVSDFLVFGSGEWVVDVKGKETSKFKRDKILWRKYGPCELWLVRGGKLVEIIPGGGA